jgi:predicted MFS family arabinose efflux permease
MGVFSYVDYRLEAPPFGLPQSLVGLVFVLWAMGMVGPFAGRLAGEAGWRRVALGGVALAAGGVTLSLANWLPAVLCGLALVTLGNFSGVTAAQLGVADATASDRGLASAMYFSSYYLAGALGGWLPGLAWEAGGWGAVALAVLTAYALALVGVLVTRGRNGAPPRQGSAAAPSGSPPAYEGPPQRGERRPGPVG